MKYTDGVASDDIIFIPSFMEICQLDQKLWGGQEQVHRPGHMDVTLP